MKNLMRENMSRQGVELMVVRERTRQRYAYRCISYPDTTTRAQSMCSILAIVCLLIAALLVATPLSHADERILSTKKRGTPSAIRQPISVPKRPRSRLLLYNAKEWSVGNRSLTKEQLTRRVAKLTQEHAKTLSRRNLVALEEFYESKVLEDWVEIALLADEAEAQGLAVTPAELQQKVDALQSTPGTRVDVEKALKSMGVTKTEFLNEMHDAILGEKLIRTRLAQAYPEDKLREIYNAMPEKFITPPQVRASHIFRALSGNETKKKKNTLYNEIKALHRRALAGEDFATIAKASDAPSRDRGGDIGWFTAVNSLPKPLDTLIFELKVGKISKVVESKFGYHILKLTDARPATGLTFEDARPAVEDYVFATVRNDLLQAIKSTKRVAVIVEGQKKQILLAPPQSSP